MATAKVFRSGNSQAVQLPKEFRLASDEVEIFRRGEIVLRANPQPWPAPLICWVNSRMGNVRTPCRRSGRACDSAAHGSIVVLGPVTGRLPHQSPSS
jgi:virulence-associated protein VagC